ncbi:ankyrin repeat-containing protein At5g02620-like [Salvia hispanica]|uniref:ankyrin repeat-containing protein At5g02620-like n=1 Tax=Salvia hispanica TaxID=49212 RepID=UPI002009D58D|nr:ankyrin repeat-containing protein At5g02620-like [Salvia hispanica]
MHGQTSIVEEVLNLNPRLARISDSQKSSPLHIAAEEGHFKIASKLLSVAPQMCWWRDDQGMNPIHLAAMNGHVEIVQHLLEESSLPAMETLERGQTVLHLCVKHGQLRVLKVLVEKLGELVYAKDDDGETLLHLAVRCNQLETIRYLVDDKTKSVENQTRNSMGKTALQILVESPPSSTTDSSYSEMKNLLTNLKNESIFHFQVLPKMTDITMVVVVLIATMAFQGGLSPPGGVWLDDTPSHKAGEAVLATTHPAKYRHMSNANTTAFVSSIITIFLVTTGLPATHFLFMASAMYAMWVAMTAITVSYGVALSVITPEERGYLVVVAVAAVVANVFGVLVVYAVVRKLHLSWKRKKRQRQDLTADGFIRRVFYWIFQHLETRGFLRADR